MVSVDVFLSDAFRKQFRERMHGIDVRRRCVGEPSQFHDRAGGFSDVTEIVALK